MEGVLWVRKSRSKLIRGWHKRYFVLTSDALLKEYAEVDATESMQSHLAVVSGMKLQSETFIGGASVKTLPFALVGRQYVFQLTLEQGNRMTVAAKNAETMQEWMRMIIQVAGSMHGRQINENESPRVRSPAVCHAIPRQSVTMPVSITMPALDDASQRISSVEDTFLEIMIHKSSDMMQFMQTIEWINGRRIKTTNDLTIDGLMIPRGSILLSISGISLQTLAPEDIKSLLKPSKVPVRVRFLQTLSKRGVLKCKLCCSLSTQLKTLAQYRNGLRDWKEQIVEIDGDVMTCYRPNDRIASSCSKTNTKTKTKTKRLVPLTGGCTVKTVHEFVADRKFCFLVSVKAYSLLFQAASQQEMDEWTAAIQRAIQVAEGSFGPLTPRRLNDPAFDALLLQSSINMRHHQQHKSLPMDDDDDQNCENNTVDSLIVSSSNDPPSSSPPPSFPVHELSELLTFLQRDGRFVEALQLMVKNTAMRSQYWRKIFGWGLDADHPMDSRAFDALLAIEIHPDDHVQVQKDIPRTSQWLAGSRGAPKLTPAVMKTRLERLQRVLHAFLIHCASHASRCDRSRSMSNEDSMKSRKNRGFYMQGMNGIAFVILQVLEDDELLVYQFFQGVITRILPHVFSIRCDHVEERDHFDLFGSLVEVANILDDVLQLYLPHFHNRLEQAGMPACLLAYKWFPTVFSDVSLTANHSQLRFETLLVVWDIVLCMGLEGIFCVALALCSTAEDTIVALGVDATAEQVSTALVSVLCELGPEDLVISVCEVLELCSHPVLLKLRNGHRRRLQIGYRSPADQENQPWSANGMVKDLDSGKVFQISKSGNMLLPVEAKST